MESVDHLEKDGRQTQKEALQRVLPFLIFETMPNAFEMTEEEGCQLFKKGPCVPCL